MAERTSTMRITPVEYAQHGRIPLQHKREEMTLDISRLGGCHFHKNYNLKWPLLDECENENLILP
jgi:hypothetical protein